MGKPAYPLGSLAQEGSIAIITIHVGPDSTAYRAYEWCRFGISESGRARCRMVVHRWDNAVVCIIYVSLQSQNIAHDVVQQY